jgi:hypothetical protein
MAMSGAKLAKYGFRRCPGICGEAKTVLRPKLPEQAQAQGINPDRCLSCEQYAVVQNAQKAGTVLGLKEFEDVLDTAGRIHGPALLMYARIFRVISDATITGTVGPVWCAAEYPQEALTIADWLDLFTVAGLTIDGRPAERPAKAIRLWRGSAPARRRRMSWTSDRAQAERFAVGVRGRLPGKLYHTLAPPEAILCVNNGRGEAEYVINTRGLTIRER